MEIMKKLDIQGWSSVEKSGMKKRIWESWNIIVPRETMLIDEKAQNYAPGTLQHIRGQSKDDNP